MPATCPRHVQVHTELYLANIVQILGIPSELFCRPPSEAPFQVSSALLSTPLLQFSSSRSQAKRSKAQFCKMRDSLLMISSRYPCLALHSNLHSVLKAVRYLSARLVTRGYCSRDSFACSDYIQNARKSLDDDTPCL